MAKIIGVCCCWLFGAIITLLGLTLMHTVEQMPQDGMLWVLKLSSVSLTLAGMVLFFLYPVVILKKG